MRDQKMTTSATLLLLLGLAFLFNQQRGSADAAAWTPVPQAKQAKATMTPAPKWQENSKSPSPTNTPAINNQPTQTDANITSIQWTDQVLVGNAKRLGLNIGSWDQFGAAQLMKNMIPNPGFESAELATVFLTTWGGTGQKIQPDNWDLKWNSHQYQIGQPPQYWSGAEYEIVTGPGAGRTGRITQFTHEDGRPTYYLDQPGAAPNAGDVVFIRHQKGGFFDKRPNGYSVADPDQIRPGSPGTQSLNLKPAPRYAASHSVVFDSLARDGDPSAGKLLLVQGSWRLEFWARAANDGDELQVEFRRVGEASFYNETIRLSKNWQRIVRTFNVDPSKDRPNSAPGPVALDFRVPSGNGGIWIDDAFLGRANASNPTAFNDKFVDYLMNLHPGILRDWGEQLGSSLDNQLAPVWARKTTGYSPLSQIPSQFHYSLPEFLQLARHISAEPWYVIPPTFSEEELQNLVAYLAAPAGSHPYADLRVEQGQNEPWTSVFPIIHLEYGNEMWGSNAGDDQFIGATVRGGKRLGEVTKQRFSMLKSSPYYKAEKLNLIVGGQNNAPERQAELESYGGGYDTIALAPYYGNLDLFATDEQRYYPLFANPLYSVTSGKIRRAKQILNNSKKGSELAIYEINMHTTFGNTPINVRNDFVSSLANGLALPLHMLTYQRDLGIRNQAAFTSVQYSHTMPDQSGFVRLWGLLRDVEATGRKRPGWLGLEIVNKAIMGNLVKITQGGANPSWTQEPMNGINAQTVIPYIQSFGFREGKDYSLVLFNVHLTDKQMVALNVLPESITADATIYTLTGNDIEANNEFGNNLSIKESSQTIWTGYPYQLPPHSITVIKWSR